MRLRVCFVLNDFCWVALNSSLVFCLFYFLFLGFGIYEIEMEQRLFWSSNGHSFQISFFQGLTLSTVLEMFDLVFYNYYTASHSHFYSNVKVNGNYIFTIFFNKCQGPGMLKKKCQGPGKLWLEKFYFHRIIITFISCN